MTCDQFRAMCFGDPSALVNSRLTHTTSTPERPPVDFPGIPFLETRMVCPSTHDSSAIEPDVCLPSTTNRNHASGETPCIVDWDVMTGDDIDFCRPSLHETDFCRFAQSRLFLLDCH